MTVPARQPDFLIIGAIKAATTWLTWQLQRHPDIFLPDPEPHYFSREFHRGPLWYAAHFTAARGDQICGEKTADYLANPAAAARIATALPHIPLIVQLRNPVDRAYSDYCMLLRRGTISGPPEDFLDPARTTFPRFLENGLYFKHIQRWLGLFDRDQFLVFLLEDVKTTPLQVLEDCCEHLGVVPLAEAPLPADGRINDGSAAYLPLGIRRILAPAKRLVAPLRSSPLFERARATLARPIAYPPLSADLRERMCDFYARDIIAMSDLLSRNLGHWLSREKVAA